jgi:Kef-type K+ transport system membrane component KefB
MLSRTIRQSSQLPIRLAVFMIGAMALLADVMGLDLALGALVAGMLIGLAVRDIEGQVMHLKMDAVGFGFLVPIFFINSGMKLDVDALFASSAGMVLTAILVASILLARLPFVALTLRSLGGREASALSLFSATTLSLIVALTEIAVKHGFMTPAEAAPLIGAGILTVILFPTIALRLAKSWSAGTHRSAASKSRDKAKSEDRPKNVADEATN